MLAALDYRGSSGFLEALRAFGSGLRLVEHSSERAPHEIESAGVAQLVEHELPKLGVAGSNPVSRSARCRRSPRRLTRMVVVDKGESVAALRERPQDHENREGFFGL